MGRTGELPTFPLPAPPASSCLGATNPSALPMGPSPLSPALQPGSSCVCVLTRSYAHHPAKLIHPAPSPQRGTESPVGSWGTSQARGAVFWNRLHHVSCFGWPSRLRKKVFCWACRNTGLNGDCHLLRPFRDQKQVFLWDWGCLSPSLIHPRAAAVARGTVHRDKSHPRPAPKGPRDPWVLKGP